jgi:aldehyde dehydrogenase (NAD+)
MATAGVEDVDLAVRSALMAAPNWRKTSGSEKATMLSKLANLIERDGEEFAAIEAKDAGILFTDSLAINIPQSVETLRYFSAKTERWGKVLNIPGGFATIRHEPYGVCAGIVPWNAPL